MMDDVVVPPAKYTPQFSSVHHVNASVACGLSMSEAYIQSGIEEQAGRQANIHTGRQTGVHTHTESFI